MGSKANPRRRRPGQRPSRPEKPSSDVNPFEQRSTARRGKAAVNGDRAPRVQPRARAEEKRKETLGVELGERHRSNVFADRRIGEGEDKLGEEDKLLARWQRETSKRRSKHADFSLDDGQEFLTHGGRPVDEFDEDEIFGDEADQEVGSRQGDDEQLDEKTTAGFHFGGGFEPVDEDGPKSHAQVMAEVIAKSKMHKADRAQEKMMLDDKTAKLDAQVDDFLSLLPKVDKLNRRPAPVSAEADLEYDKLVNALATERRAAATEPAKKPEQLEREEKERLEQLEKRRLARMEGVQEVTGGGDELSDDYQSDASDDVEPALHEDFSNMEDTAKQTAGGSLASNGAAPSHPVRDDDSIPYAFKTCPSTYQQLLVLFVDLTPTQRATVVERLQKCFSVVKSNGGRSPLRNLLRLVLRRVATAALLPKGSGAAEVFHLLPQVHSLSLSSPEVVGGWARGVLSDLYTRVQLKGPSTLLEYDSLIVFHCFCRLFSATDFRHPVLTPALLIMAQSISLTNFDSIQNFAKGLVMMTLIEGVNKQSSRICSEAIQFLARLMQWCTTKLSSCPATLSDDRNEPLKITQVSELSDEPREVLRLANAGLQCAQAVVDRLSASGQVSLDLVLDPILDSVEKLRREAPMKLSLQAESFLERAEDSLSVIRKSQTPLTLYSRKVSVPKLLNPRFAEPGAPPKRISDKSEVAQLKKKLRREERSAARELQRDTSFVQRHLLDEREALDRHRLTKRNEAVALFEDQERTWKEQVKKKKKLSGKW